MTQEQEKMMKDLYFQTITDKELQTIITHLEISLLPGFTETNIELLRRAEEELNKRIVSETMNEWAKGRKE